MKGAMQTILKNRPVCMIEIYPKFLQDNPASIFNFFFNQGYNCYYNVFDKGLRPVFGVEEGVAISSNENMIRLHDGDFLFVPIEKR